MLDTKQFLSAIKQISEEKGIAEESVLEEPIPTHRGAQSQYCQNRADGACE